MGMECNKFILDRQCLKIEKENAKAMIEGFEKDGKIIHQAIYLATTNRKFPKLITLRWGKHDFDLSSIGKRLHANDYVLPNKYIAELVKSYPIRNEIPFWKVVCSNGLFDIWDEEGGPFKRFLKSKKRDSSAAKILLLRIYEINKPFTEGEIKNANDRIDIIDKENREVTIKKPMISDKEFNKIKLLLEESIDNYKNAPPWNREDYEEKSQKHKEISLEEMRQRVRSFDLGLPHKGDYEGEEDIEMIRKVLQKNGG